MAAPAGQLHHRVTIQAPSYTESDTGAKKLGAWSDVRTVWAEVKAVQATEQEADGPPQVEERIQYQVTIRYAEDVTTKNRFVWRGKTLNIEGIYDPDGYKTDLVAQCQERGA